MIRPVLCGLLAAAGLAAGMVAQTRSDGAGHCAGLPSFGPHDSLNTADLRLENKDLRVRVNAKGPELHLRLEPDLKSRHSDTDVTRVGWIRVFSCETGDLMQSLEVANTSGTESFLRFFEARDVNFDNYLDIAAVRESGAKWGRNTWWVFSPALGKFISNAFTRDLGKVSHNGLVLDAARQSITANQLTDLTGCGATRNIYHVEQNRRLVLIHKEEIGGNSDGCTLTTSDRVNGQIQVTKVQQFPPYRGPAAPQ